MPNLEELEQEYKDAAEAFEEDRSEENHAAYEEAKTAFVDARAAQRREEENDPNHSRGTGLVVVSEEENGE